MTTRIEIHWLGDDGLVPNNPSLPLLVYRGGLRDETSAPPAEAAIIDRFARHNWSNAWIDGIYPFHHYHATVHEVLGLAAGWAAVQMGGPGGPCIRLDAGDATLIPAGVGHCRLDGSRDLSVIGAYPGGADWDLVRASPDTRQASVQLIAHVALPAHDPVSGRPFVVPARF